MNSTGRTQDFYFISDLDFPFGQNLDEDSLARHDAVSDLGVNGAVGMTFLADLGDPHQGVPADPHPRSQGKLMEDDALGCQILGEIAVFKLDALIPDFFNALFGQHADLAVLHSGMGVMFQSEILNEAARLDIVFLLALVFADIDGQYPSLHDRLSYC